MTERLVGSERMPSSWAEAREHLAELREFSREMGGPDAIERLHARGKLTPRERIARLCDPGSFREFGALVTGLVRVAGRVDRMAPADAIVTGWAEIAGRKVVVMADDGTITAGARGPGGRRKAASAINLAATTGLPLVILGESSAGRMGGLMGAQFAGPSDRPESSARVRPRPGIGRSPVLSVLLGTAVGGAAFRTLNADFSIMSAGAAMAIAGPPMVKGGIGAEVDIVELGGAELHRKVTGLVDYVADDEDQALATVRRVLSYLPDNGHALPPRGDLSDPPDRAAPELVDIVPLNHRKPYDMHRVIRSVVDHGELLEIKADFAKNMIVGFARLHGHAVGVLANQPMHLGGIVDANAAIKLVRFAQMCNAFNIPLVFLQDQPGFIIGPASEREGALRQVVRTMNTVYNLTTPVLTVLVRKAYGFSTVLLGGKPVGADLVVGWPSSAISLAGPELAVNTLLAKEKNTGELSEERTQEYYAHYRRTSQARWAAYEFLIDDLIDPSDTRKTLVRALDRFVARRQHALAIPRRVDVP